MANKLNLEVVTPRKLVASEEVDLCTVPGTEGVFGVMANHAPILSTLNVGQMHYNKDGDSVKLAISGGFVEVSENKMTVLAEAAEVSEEIDVERALRAKERAEKRLQQAKSGKADIDEARALAAMARATARLKVAGKMS